MRWEIHTPLKEFLHYSFTSSKQKSGICHKFQHRFVGPFKVTRKLSPVPYVANINGVEKTVHALKMVHDPISRYLNKGNERKDTTEGCRVPEFDLESALKEKPLTLEQEEERRRYEEDYEEKIAKQKFERKDEIIVAEDVEIEDIEGGDDFYR